MINSGKALITHSPASTKKLASNLISVFLKNVRKERPVFCLFGDLGAGKTTFVQGLGHALKIRRKLIKSPTFVFLHEYQGKKGKLYHFDLYRIRHNRELLHELHEVLHRRDGFIVIEWADRVKRFLPRKRYDIIFKHCAPRERKISVMSR